MSSVTMKERQRDIDKKNKVIIFTVPSDSVKRERERDVFDFKFNLVQRC